MKVNTGAFIMERLNLEQHFKRATIIGRVGHVKAYDMQMLVQS
jgi:hypothetical protein